MATRLLRRSSRCCSSPTRTEKGEPGPLAPSGSGSRSPSVWPRRWEGTSRTPTRTDGACSPSTFPVLPARSRTPNLWTGPGRPDSDGSVEQILDRVNDLVDEPLPPALALPPLPPHTALAGTAVEPGVGDAVQRPEH